MDTWHAMKKKKKTHLLQNNLSLQLIILFPVLLSVLISHATHILINRPLLYLSPLGSGLGCSKCGQRYPSDKLLSSGDLSFFC